MNDAGKVAFTPKGAYVSTETYEYLDTVQYNGNCYAAKKTTTGNTPPTTGTYSDDYWAVLVIGGASVPVATLDTPGLVKAGADIVVNSDGDMSLKTDFEEQTEIAGLTGSEDRKTLLGKIAKAIIDFIAHKTLKATASVLGHVKISNSAAITTEGEYALDAVEKNASVEGTLAYQIAQQNNNLGAISIAHISDVICNSGKTATIAYLALKPGTYIICSNIAWGTSTATDRRDLYITAGEYNDAKLACDTRFAVGGYNTLISIATVIRFTSETTIRLYATQRSGEDLAILCGDVLTAVRVSV